MRVSANVSGAGYSANPDETGKAPPEVRNAQRNALFSVLVLNDDDLVGLVAYSILKQDEADWLTAFRNARNRMPTPWEVQAYIIGQSTSRRLASYRKIASSTLSGAPPVLPGDTVAPLPEAEDSPSLLHDTSIVGYMLTALIFIIMCAYFVAQLWSASSQSHLPQHPSHSRPRTAETTYHDSSERQVVPASR